MDPDSSYKKFEDLYMVEFEKSFPLTTVSLSKSKNNWFDHELQNLLRNKEKLFKKYINKKLIKQGWHLQRLEIYTTIQSESKNKLITP